MSQTPLELVKYYQDLLILQYVSKPRARATIGTIAGAITMPQTSVQALSFAPAPTSGSFTASYLGTSSAAIAWNASAADIQTALRAVAGLGSVTVTGSVAGGLVITMAGIYAPADLLVIDSSLLLATAAPVAASVVQTDQTLPVAVLNGFNPATAVGAQLDIIGKYVGVQRTFLGFSGLVTLADADFLTLIQLAILKNAASSDLDTIQSLIYQFFPNEVLVFDYANMQMSYLISTQIGSQSLVQLFVKEGLLPRPTGVALSIIYAPIINKFFGMRTYQSAAYNVSPLNSYTDYQTTRPWVSYANAIST